MARGCSLCGSKTVAPERQLPAQQTAQFIEKEFSNDPDFIQIEYFGPGYTHVIPSHSGILVKYGKRDYGTHTTGHIFWVHKDDMKKRPDLFKEYVVEEEVKPAAVVEEKGVTEEVKPARKPRARRTTKAKTTKRKAPVAK